MCSTRRVEPHTPSRVQTLRRKSHTLRAGDFVPHKGSLTGDKIGNRSADKLKIRAVWLRCGRRHGELVHSLAFIKIWIILLFIVQNLLKYRERRISRRFRGDFEAISQLTNPASCWSNLTNFLRFTGLIERFGLKFRHLLGFVLLFLRCSLL